MYQVEAEIISSVFLNICCSSNISGWLQKLMLQSKEREGEEGGKIRRDGKSLEDADLSDPRAMQNCMSCNGFTLV